MFPFQISYILGVFFKLCLPKAARRKSYNILGVVVLLPEDTDSRLGLEFFLHSNPELSGILRVAGWDKASREKL